MENLQDTQYSTMTARDYLKVIFRQMPVMILSFIVVVATAALGLMYKTPEYSASVKMLISAQKPVESPYYKDISGASRSLLLTQSEIAVSSPVIQMTSEALGLWRKPLDYEKHFCSPFKEVFVKFGTKAIETKLERMPEEKKTDFLLRKAIKDLKADVKVEPIRDTDMFRIIVSDYSPLGAAVIANTISRAYIIFDLQQQAAELSLKYGPKYPLVKQLNDSIDQMRQNLAGKPLPDVEAIGPASVKVIEQADVPSNPDGPADIVVFLMACVMAVFLAVMLAFVFEYADQTFKDRRDIEDTLGVPYLGSVKSKAKLKDYNTLADQLYLLVRDKNIKTILISGVTPGDGASDVSYSLARYFSSEIGRKVLYVETDMRKRGRRSSKQPLAQGLAEYIAEGMSFDQTILHPEGGTDVVKAGRSKLNPLTLLGSPRMAEFTAAAVKKYDLVIFDAPPFNICQDAALLAPTVDAAVIVVRDGYTRRQAAKAALERLLEVKAEIIGAVLNNRKYPLPKFIYRSV